MKLPITRIHAFLLAWTYLATIAYCMAVPPSLREEFEKRYNAWLTWTDSNPCESDIALNKNFESLIDLGLPALPLMIEKMEHCEATQNYPVPWINSAQNTFLNRLSKRKFINECPLGDHELETHMYLQWWHDGRFKTGEPFESLYAKWKAEKTKTGYQTNKAQPVTDYWNVWKLPKEMIEVRYQIKVLGLPVLSYLVEKVDDAPEFIGIIAQLTDTQLPANMTGAECKAWWEKNKHKYEFPGQETGTPPKEEPQPVSSVPRKPVAPYIFALAGILAVVTASWCLWRRKKRDKKPSVS